MLRALSHLCAALLLHPANAFASLKLRTGVGGTSVL